MKLYYDHSVFAALESANALTKTKAARNMTTDNRAVSYFTHSSRVLSDLEQIRVNGLPCYLFNRYLRLFTFGQSNLFENN